MQRPEFSLSVEICRHYLKVTKMKPSLKIVIKVQTSSAHRVFLSVGTGFYSAVASFLFVTVNKAAQT